MQTPNFHNDYVGEAAKVCKMHLAVLSRLSESAGTQEQRSEAKGFCEANKEKLSALL